MLKSLVEKAHQQGQLVFLQNAQGRLLRRTIMRFSQVLVQQEDGVTPRQEVQQDPAALSQVRPQIPLVAAAALQLGEPQETVPQLLAGRGYGVVLLGLVE